LKDTTMAVLPSAPLKKGYSSEEAGWLGITLCEDNFRGALVGPSSRILDIAWCG
jgi:hypothetical protein